MFGLELRRSNNIQNLYKDIDIVLKKAGVEPGTVPASVAQQGVANSLQKMLLGDYFNICTVDAATKLCNIVISSERYNLYASQHCVKYSEMLPEFRQTLAAMLLDDFR